MEIVDLINTSGVDRRDIAEHLGISYQSLGNRIGRFVQWKKGEIEKIEKFITKKTKDN